MSSHEHLLRTRVDQAGEDVQPGDGTAALPHAPVPLLIAGVAGPPEDGSHDVRDGTRRRTRLTPWPGPTAVGAADAAEEIEAEEVARSVVQAVRGGAAPSRRVRDTGAAENRITRVVSGGGSIGASGGELTDADSHELRARTGAGSPVPGGVRSRLEAVLGADLSDVRLHADATAARLNRQMSASAFTYGKDVYFRDGLPDPGTDTGLRVLSHELTHTAQQSGAPERRPVGPNAPEDGAVVRREIRVHLTDAKGNAEERSIDAVLKSLGIKGPRQQRSWFLSEISPHLSAQFGVQRFMGMMHPRRSLSRRAKPAPGKSGSKKATSKKPRAEESDLRITIPPTATLNLVELNLAVISAINAHVLSSRLETGHSKLGNLSLLKRAGFPQLVKDSFSKGTVISQIQKEGGSKLEARQIHLRHFVMGSWFRAMPALLEKAELSDNEQAYFLGRMKNLIPRLAPLAGTKDVSVQGTLQADAERMAYLLHNLMPNLNAGEGPENSIIGFMSHGLTNLAFTVLAEGTSVNRADAPGLITAALDHVGVVAKEDRESFENTFRTAHVFESMLPQTDSVSATQLASALHQVAYNLGMDFMKRDVGRAEKAGTLPLHLAQAELLPIGDTLYSMIRAAPTRKPTTTDLDKLFNKVEAAVVTFEKAWGDSSGKQLVLPSAPDLPSTSGHGDGDAMVVDDEEQSTDEEGMTTDDEGMSTDEEDLTTDEEDLTTDDEDEGVVTLDLMQT